MNWRKRSAFKYTAIAVAVLFVLAIATAVTLYLLSGREPAWYAKAKSAVPQQAQHAEQNLIKMQNWATQTTAGAMDAKPDALKQYTIELTDEQINALIAKWSDAAGIGPKLDAQVRDIRVRLADGKITVAGRLVSQDRVISAVFEPKETPDGYSQIVLDGVQAGDVPLPLVAVDGQREALARHLKVDPAKLGIDNHNYATRETAGVYYLGLMADLLAGKSPDLYGLLPQQQMGQSAIVATRVRKLAIEEGKVALTVELLSPGQRKTLVEQLTALASEAPATASAKHQ